MFLNRECVYNNVQSISTPIYFLDHVIWYFRKFATDEWHYNIYPTHAREFQGFRVWGKFVLRKLELTDPLTNLAYQVIVGQALNQSLAILRTRVPYNKIEFHFIFCHPDYIQIFDKWLAKYMWHMCWYISDLCVLCEFSYRKCTFWKVL